MWWGDSGWERRAGLQELRGRFGLKALRHIDPPMNFIRDESAVECCLRAIEESSPFRFCFLAIGSPQQEIIAQKLKERGVARGLALCIGASINFITGVEKRAPLWIRESRASNGCFVSCPESQETGEALPGARPTYFPAAAASRAAVTATDSGAARSPDHAGRLSTIPIGGNRQP